MVAGVRVGDCFAPKQGGEDHDGKEKKDAGNLEPENAAHATEGTQKAADAAAHRSTGLAHRLRSLNGGVGCCLAGGAVPVVGTPGLGAGNWSRLMRLRSGSRRLRVALKELRCSAPGDAHSEAEGAANHARSHSVYDGSSGLWRLVPW